MTDSPAAFALCPHDRGPGITVCLRCRADTHRKAAASRQRVAARVGIAIVVTLVVAVAGNSAVAARGASVQGGAAATDSQSTRSERFQVSQAGGAESGQRQSQGVSPTAPPMPRIAASIDAGRTDLDDGRYVERSGDSITVRFDTPVFRTRRHDKFEQVVRTTLPAVYAAYADSVLASIPEGDLGATGDLLTELPEHGVSLPAHDGWRLTVWPGTRPGHDGPLVVSYRITLARAQ